MRPHFEFQYVIPISNCWKYYPNSKGLIGGIIVSGVGMGTFIFNLLSTYLVNPNSENADVNGLFDSDVANNVPYMIRILVACWASLGVVGITLIFPFKPETQKVDQYLLKTNDEINKSSNDNSSSTLEKTKTIEKSPTFQALNGKLSHTKQYSN